MGQAAGSWNASVCDAKTVPEEHDEGLCTRQRVDLNLCSTKAGTYLPKPVTVHAPTIIISVWIVSVHMTAVRPPAKQSIKKNETNQDGMRVEVRRITWVKCKLNCNVLITIHQLAIAVKLDDTRSSELIRLDPEVIHERSYDRFCLKIEN